MEKPVWDDEQKEEKFLSFSFLGKRGAVVALAVVAGLVGIWLLYYVFGSDKILQCEVPTIAPVAEAMKTQPQNPGGLVVPHQDKKIYENLAAEGVIEEVILSDQPERPLNVGPSDASQDTVIITPVEEEIQPVVINMPVTNNTVVTQEAPIPAPAAAPKAEAPAPAPTPEKKAVEKKKEKAPKAQKGGSHKVQLASMPSKALAEKEMKILKKNYKTLLGPKSLSVASKTLADRGSVWRIQVGGFASKKDAQAFCAKIKSKKGQCILAR